MKLRVDGGIWAGLPPSGWNSVKWPWNVGNECHEIVPGQGLEARKG